MVAETLGALYGEGQGEDSDESVDSGDWTAKDGEQFAECEGAREESVLGSDAELRGGTCVKGVLEVDSQLRIHGLGDLWAGGT